MFGIRVCKYFFIISFINKLNFDIIESNCLDLNDIVEKKNIEHFHTPFNRFSSQISLYTYT